MEVKFKDLKELDPIAWKKHGKPKIACAVTDLLTDCPGSLEVIQFEGCKFENGLKRYTADYDEEAKEWSFVDGNGEPWYFTYKHAFSILENRNRYNRIKTASMEVKFKDPKELDEALAKKADVEKLIAANKKLNEIIKWLTLAAVVIWVATLAIVI